MVSEPGFLLFALIPAAAPPIETVSMLFELLFLAFALVSVVALIAALVMFASRRRRAAVRTVVIFGVAWVVYLAVVAGVAASTHQRVVSINQDLCFDEMCFATVALRVQPQLGPAKHPISARGEFYIVTVRVGNHARGYRTERELGIRPRLWRDGTYYDISSCGQRAYEAEYGSTPKLTDPLVRGETILSVQVFNVPRDAPTPGLVLDHGFTPGYFVIGESPVFHKPTVFRLGPS